METKNVDFAETTNPDEKPVKVRVPIRGDLRQLYEFAHECTHTFDIDNGWTETRLVLAEVAPQCMERLLDEYLLGMSEAELKKYGFDKRVLEKDIQDRRLSTFFNRLWNIETLNGKHPIKDRRKDSNYMLAQIYSAHFNKFDKSQKRNKLISFIKCVNNDDFDGANNCFGLLINRNQKLH